MIGPVTRPNFAAWWTKSATLALQISFLLGRQLTFGQAPPIHRRSTTAVRCPDPARCHARDLPLLPLPRMRTSYSSGRGMLSLPVRPVSPRTRTDTSLGAMIISKSRTRPRREFGSGDHPRPRFSRCGKHHCGTPISRACRRSRRHLLQEHSPHVGVVLPKDRRRAEPPAPRGNAGRRGVAEFIELPSQSADPIAPSSSGMMRRARCLYRSPPPSDESMCQIGPCVNTLCSSTGRRQLPRAPARPRPRAVHRRA